jgi:hypothetical protein
MAKKAKKRTNQMPRLSLVDKLIYWIIMLVLICLYFLLILVPINLRDLIAFRDDTVIAATGDASLLLVLIPFMTFFLMTFILWEQAYQDRRPIFGIRNFKYGPPAWPKIYPLFMKKKPRVYVSPRARKQRRALAVLLAFILLVSFLPFPLALYGRTVLHHDGSITEYSPFNRIYHAFYSGECTEVRIGTYRYSNGKSNPTTHWGVKMTFIMENGRKYVFDHRDFRRDTQTDICYWLTAMLNIKGRHRPEIISYHGTDKLDRVISNRNLSEAEQALLYQLFQP